jgi:hypothetical protein
MTPDLLESVRPYITIYTQEPVPTHLAIAARPVAKAVDAASHDPASNSPGVTQAQPGAAPQGPPQPQQGQPQTQAQAQPQAQPGQPGAGGAPAAQDAVIVSIDAVAHSFDGGVFARRAVIKLDFNAPKGYTVLDWRRIALP